MNGNEKTVQIFGKRYDAPEFDDAIVVWTPVGEPCVMCAEPIEPGDAGVMMPTLRVDSERVRFEPEHIECHLRSVFGSLEHLTGECTCKKGHPDTDGNPYREQARRVMAYLIERKAEQGESAWLETA